jgi:hypothetical protein
MQSLYVQFLFLSYLASRDISKAQLWSTWGNHENFGMGYCPLRVKKMALYFLERKEEIGNN